MKLMSVLWKKLKVCRITFAFFKILSCEQIKSVGRPQQKRAQEKRRAISPIAPEYSSNLLKDIETEDFSAALSTVAYEESPLDEERSQTAIPDGAGRGVVAGSSKVPDVVGGNVGHSQKSENADDDHSDDQLFEVSQEKAPPPKTADVEPITEPEDRSEGKSNSEIKFKPTIALLTKFNKGTCVTSISVGC